MGWCLEPEQQFFPWWLSFQKDAITNHKSPKKAKMRQHSILFGEIWAYLSYFFWLFILVRHLLNQNNTEAPSSTIYFGWRLCRGFQLCHWMTCQISNLAAFGPIRNTSDLGIFFEIPKLGVALGSKQKIHSSIVSKSNSFPRKSKTITTKLANQTIVKD